MKKLGIDARLYHQTGVGTYIRNLLYFLQKKEYSTFRPTLFVMEEDMKKVKKEISEFEVIEVNAKWHSFQEQTQFLADLLKANVDLMHFTYFSYPLWYTRKSMSTVHDLTPLLFKTGKASTKTSIIYKTKYTAYKLLLKNQIRRSEKIITPTNTVKKQIVSIFGKEVSDKIIPIYEGIDEALITVKPDTEIIKKNNIHNYFLYVGNFYPHKNVERLIEAFKTIPETHTLVLAGPNDFFAERMRELIKGFNLQKRVKMLHNTDKSELKALYINAQALVHASLSEGFGLPLIEAVSLDVPVIASNIEVYRELLNTNYVSFDPTDSKDIAGKIISFIEDKPKFDYNTILKKFSFKNMAEKHYQVYSELLS